MELSNTRLVPAPPDRVWAALNDPDVLKACIPGCESFDRTPDGSYATTVAARVGPVSARFSGRVELADVEPPVGYTIRFAGQGGAAGFAKGGAQVRLSRVDGKTKLSYDVKANVGGKLAQIGSRLIDGAARKVADDFFKNFNDRLSAAKPGEHSPQHDAEAVPRDPDLPSVSDTTLRFLAAGALVIYGVSLLTLFD